MKKILLFASLLIQTVLYGQSVPNSGFENWTSATYDSPQGYVDNSNRQAYFKCGAAFNCVKTTDAYHGTYAIQLTTHTSATDTCFGYFVNSSNTNGNPLTWTGGIPYNQMATGIKGYYKSNVAAGDSAGIIAIFRAGGNPVGFYAYKFSGTHNTYTPFSFTFSPPLLATPDSLIFAAVSSDVFNNYAASGSMFQLDSVSFTGVASQPALFNGDFENWQSQTLNIPNGWYISSGQGLGYARTTDSYAGTYAMEVQTYLGDNNGSPVAQAGEVATGYCIGNSSCTWQGGYPFSNQVDTLSFYYKYAPSGNDTAQVYLMFKKNGAIVSGAGTQIYNSAGTYQYAQIPFNTGTAVDTVIVQLQSSSWNNSALSFVGSDFKVDNINFKSQITGISNPFVNAGKQTFFYPNPVSNILNIMVGQNSSSEIRLTIYDVTGRAVREEWLQPSGNIKQLDVSILQPGIYVCELSGAGVVSRNRFVKE
jgi:hypothetical protein